MGPGQLSPAGHGPVKKPSQEQIPGAGPPWQVPLATQVLLKPQQYEPVQQPLPQAEAES